MKKDVATILLIGLSISWWLFVFLYWVFAGMGDCPSTENLECLGAKRYLPTLILWRALAIQLGAVVVYLLYLRRQER
jgi:hypothetical protein